MKYQIIGTILIALINSGQTIDLIVDVGAGTEECFYQNVSTQQILSVDYVVIRSQAEHDIIFKFYETLSDQKTYYAKDNSSEGSYSLVVPDDGLYEICFDNSFSLFSKKTIRFQVTVENEDEVDAEWKKVGANLLMTDLSFNPKDQENIKRIMSRVRIQMSTIEKILRLQLSIKLKHEGLVELNYNRVNNWSIYNLILLMVVGIIQVVMVKSLFDSKYRISKQLLKFKQNLRN